MRFTAIDFETANSSRSSVCAVGLVTVEADEIVTRSHQLIRPVPCCFDPFNVSIHGISEGDVADAPTFAEFWPTLWSRMAGPVVAHNAAFDMSVLRHALSQCSIQYPEIDYFCTRVIAQLTWPEHPTYALDHVASSLDISFEHHNAEEDARACALIALASCKHLNAGSLYDLQGICGLKVGHLFGGGYCPCSVRRTRAGSSIAGVKAADIVPTTTEFDEEHPYFGRTFVFTGAMESMDRRDAMQAVVNRGGICHDTVKKDTNYVVIGQKGYVGYRSGFKSAKMLKAEKMRSQGMAIEILPEKDFLDLL